MIWPFKRKSAIYRSYYVGGFGSYNVDWTNIYTAQQNNKLLINYFNNLGEVAAPVLKYSDGAGQITIDTDDEEVKKLLKSPNYYQGWNEFFSLIELYKRLLGESIIDAFAPTKLDEELTLRKKPESLFCLSPEYMGIVTNKNKDFRFNLIEKYIFDPKEPDKKDAIEISPENILHLKEVNPNFQKNQYLFGLSRYSGTYRNIESIIAGYDAKVNLYKNGPRLIITGKTQGEFASMAKSEDIETVQTAMSKYGHGKDKYNNLITDVPLDVHNASLNVQQLQINEMNDSDFRRLCDVQNIDSKVFSDSSSSTFSNKEMALKDFYNNAFRSEIDGTVKDLETYLDRWWPGLELVPNYSQISEIIAANLEENQRLLEDCKLGLITRNTYFEAIGKERVNEQGFDEYYFYLNGWYPLIQTNETNI